MATPGSRRGVTLTEFFGAGPENRKVYADWLRDPATQRFIDLVDASIRPFMKPEGMSDARYGGLIDGRYETLRVLTHLDTIYDAVASVQQIADVPETYGVEGILSHWGVKQDETKKKE